MKKFIIIGCISIAFFATLQGYWFTNASDTNSQHFDHSVSVALYTVADTMSEHAIVEKRSSNFFYVKTNSPLSHQEVDTMIRKEFAQRNIDLDYELGVYNAEDDSLVYGNYVKSTAIVQDLKNVEVRDDLNKNFAVLFSTKKSSLFGQNETWLTFTFILLTASGFFLIRFTKRPSRINLKPHEIQLGNSSLDYHNHTLVVNHTTFQLTHKENQILKLFFEKPDQVIDRNVFLEKVWEKDGFFVARSMDVFISKIRKYLSNDPSIKIENLRSIGYRLHVTK